MTWNYISRKYISARNSLGFKQIKISTNYKSKRETQLEFGYHLTDYDIEYDVEEDSQRSRDINDERQSNTLLHAAYINFRKPIFQNLGINLGVRSSYFQENEQVYVEPRINLGWKTKEYLSLHFNYGQYFQFISQISEFRGNSNGINTPLWALSEDLNIPVLKAELFQFGAIYDRRNWTIDLQAYRKSIDGLSSRAYDFEMVPKSLQ